MYSISLTGRLIRESFLAKKEINGLGKLFGDNHKAEKREFD